MSIFTTLRLGKLLRGKNTLSRVLSIFVLFVPILLLSAQESFAQVRINSAGSSFTDSTGSLWSADQNFSGGSPFSISSSIDITGTTDDVLYRTERYGANFSYNIPVTNGTYQIKLLFAEIYYNRADARVFNVSLESNQVITNLDIWTKVGRYAAYSETHNVTVSDGTLNVQFTGVIENAKISAIQVIPLTTTSSSVRINSSGVNYTDSLGNIWETDKNFVGGSPFSISSSIDIAGTTDDVLYRTERYGANFSYAIPVVNGSYEISLHFAEIYYNQAGVRIFDAFIEGTQVINDLDIWSQVGRYAPYVRSFIVNVNDGILNIQFVGVIENAKISAISVVPSTSNPPSSVSVNPTSLNFGEVLVGTTSPSQKVDVTNNGTSPISISQLSFTGTNASNFQTSSTVPINVNGGQTISIPITFTPSASGTRSASLSIMHNGTPSPIAVALAGTGTSPTPSQQTIRINSSGSNYTDGSGALWVQDTNFVGGSPFSIPSSTEIANTLDDTLYRTERYGANFSYVIPVQNGTYQITLHFAEIYFNSAGSRVFNVSAEGTAAISNLDIWARVGKNAAYTETFVRTVGDGTLNIQLTGVVENAKISAIEVVPAGVTVSPSSLSFGQTLIGSSSAPQNIQVTNSSASAVTFSSIGLTGDAASFNYTQAVPFSVNSGQTVNIPLTFSPNSQGVKNATFILTQSGTGSAFSVALSGTGIVTSANPQPDIRINTGGAAFTTGDGRAFAADFGFTGGSPFSTTIAIANTEDDQLYQSERYGNFSYAFPVQNGIYSVKLHFAEIYWSNAGERLFNVNIENSAVLTNYDIWADVGKFVATVKSFQRTVTDGILNINFVTVNDAAKVSAIEISLIQELGQLSINPATVSFGDAIVSGPAVNKNLSLTNTGTSTITVSAITTSSPTGAGFSHTASLPIALTAGTSQNIPLKFQPTTLGLKSGELIISSNDPQDLDGVKSIPLSGRAISNNPALKVIPSPVDLGEVIVTSNSGPIEVRIKNEGAQTLNVTSVSLTSGSASEFIVNAATPVALNLDQEATFTVDFNPQELGIRNGAISIVSNDLTDVGGVRTLPISGKGVDGSIVRFQTNKILDNATPGAVNFSLPTTLMFGPDGRLYVGQYNGLIHIFTLDQEKNVIATEVITTIYNSPTYNEDGSLATGVQGRLITGIYLDPLSSPTAPVLYTVHSDMRIGENNDSLAQQIDTDGGILTRLVGPNYDLPGSRTDLVTGLPRSRENHAPNGLLIGPDGWLYISIGGNTNYGAPSQFFSNLPEVNLSAGVVRLNLAALSTPIDVSAGSHAGSVSGDGEIPGVFEVYATGYRNGYDILFHSNGKFYINVNEGNNGLGNTPSAADGCPLTPSINPGTGLDKLFIVTSGAYGGHPVPARGHCVLGNGSAYSPPIGPDPAYTPHIWQYAGSISTNGMAEYGSLSFNSQLLGNILSVTTFVGNEVRSLQLSPNGTSVVGETILASGLDGPIDVVVDRDGVIFVAEYSGNSVTKFTPIAGGLPGDNDGDGILDIDDPDDDNDGYTDEDEIANGTNPFNPADVPPDFDGDFISDLNDPDDDNDGILDIFDRFVFDASNGNATIPPILYEWNPGDDFAGGLKNTGFTGFELTSNGTGFIPGRVNVGAAGGFLSIVPTTGDMKGNENAQDNALMLGVDATPNTGIGQFTFTTKVVDPFKSPPAPPLGSESAGLFLANNEDNFIRLVISGNTGSGSSGIQLSTELDGVFTANAFAPVNVPLPGANGVELFLAVNPDQGTIAARYRVDSSDPNQIITLGTLSVSNNANLSRFFTQGLGIGILATRAGQSNSQFVAVFDYFRLQPGAVVNPAADTGSKAFLKIDAGDTLISSSTYISGSYRLTNNSTAGQTITRFRLDLRSSFLRDNVYDPFATAGDPVGKDLTIDSDPGVGFTGRTFLGPHDGGFDIVDLTFNNFTPGNTLTFSVDVDPTSIKGAEPPGPSESGSVSGLEMMGALVTIYFSDGTYRTAELFRTSGSPVASETQIVADLPTAPNISVLGIPITPTATTIASQTIRVTGSPGATIALIVAEAGLFLDGAPNGGFDIDPFEANSLIAITEVPATLNGSGTVDIPITLTKNHPSAGYNHIFAVVKGSAGKVSSLSDVKILQYTP